LVVIRLPKAGNANRSGRWTKTAEGVEILTQAPFLMRSDDLEERIEGIATRLADKLKCGCELTDEQQRTAGELARTLPYLTRLKSGNINVVQAELALEALISRPSSNRVQIPRPGREKEKTMER
jgi:hypothetical protein